MRRNIAEHQIVEGGSTITQQTAKLLLARRSPARSRRGSRASCRRPCSRSVWSIGSPSSEILALYLNLAAYGNQVVGAGRASYAYFGHDASMLTPAQAAFLAGLPQRPTGFNPYRNPKSALARQRAVLRRMQASGAITAEQSREAADERLVFTKLQTPFAARHFVERVLASVGTKRARSHRDDDRRRAAGGRRRNHQQPAGRSSIGMAPRTSPSSSSTTHAASGSRGKVRATTSIRPMAARSTASCRRGSRDRR